MPVCCVYYVSSWFVLQDSLDFQERHDGVLPKEAKEVKDLNVTCNKLVRGPSAYKLWSSADARLHWYDTGKAKNAPTCVTEWN
jgi:hypothetical protein